MTPNEDEFWIHESEKNILFEDVYEIQKQLGKRPYQPLGSASHVSYCTQRGTPYAFAVKTIQKKVNWREHPSRIGNLLRLQHQNLVRLKEVFESRNSLFIISELALGGTLFNRIPLLHSYTEEVISHYMQQILSGVNYLHMNDIIHKNLKPENILLSSPEPDAIVKISDTNLCAFIEEDMDIELVCGNPIFCAPELLLSRLYTNAVDYWPLGIMLYIMLCGISPFMQPTESELYRAIMSCSYSCSMAMWKHISLNAQDLMSRFLVAEPSLRLSAYEALKHPWIADKVANTEMLYEAQANIKEFNSQREILRQKLIERKHNKPISVSRTNVAGCKVVHFGKTK